MTPAEIVGIGVGAMALLTGFWRVGRFIFQVEQIVKNELTPNGGSSVKDQVGEVNQKLGRLETKIDTYISEHAKHHVAND